MLQSREVLTINTTISLDDLERLLDEACAAEWDAIIQSVSRDTNNKEIAVYFETTQDRKAFQNVYENL